MNRNVKKITEGAMIVALYGLFLFLNTQTAGILVYNFLFVLPIPMVIYSVRHDTKYSVVVAISVLILTFMISMIQTLFYIGASLILGVVYGSLAKTKKSNGYLLSVAVIIGIVVNILTGIVFASFFGLDFNVMMAEYENLMNSFFKDTLSNLSVDIGSFLLMAAVLGIMLTGVLEGILVHLLSKIVLKRLKVEVDPIKPLSMWKRSKLMGYLSFIFFSCGIFISYVKINETTTLIIMCLQLLSIGYLMTYGFIATTLYGAVRFKRNIGLLIVVLLFVFNYIALYAICIMGFFYLTTDMKERIMLGR